MKEGELREYGSGWILGLDGRVFCHSDRRQLEWLLTL
jgi:hypothetical protein